jgi:hypothetical protein
MSKINLNILDKIINVYESIDQLIESNLHWKNQYKIFMKELFEEVCFQQSNNNYIKIFNFCLDILHLRKKIYHN